MLTAPNAPPTIALLTTEAAPQTTPIKLGYNYGACAPGQRPRTGAECELGATAADGQNGNLTMRVLVCAPAGCTSPACAASESILTYCPHLHPHAGCLCWSWSMFSGTPLTLCLAATATTTAMRICMNPHSYWQVLGCAVSAVSPVGFFIGFQCLLGASLTSQMSCSFIQRRHTGPRDETSLPTHECDILFPCCGWCAKMLTVTDICRPAKTAFSSCSHQSVCSHGFAAVYSTVLRQAELAYTSSLPALTINPLFWTTRHTFWLFQVC